MGGVKRKADAEELDAFLNLRAREFDAGLPDDDDDTLNAKVRERNSRPGSGVEIFNDGQTIRERFVTDEDWEAFTNEQNQNDSSPAFPIIHSNSGHSVDDRTDNAGRGNVDLPMDALDYADVARRTKPILAELEARNVAKANFRAPVATVPHVAFPTRGVSVSPLSAIRPTRGKPTVEFGKSSKFTWQFRLRWNSEPGRPVVYVATVADSTFEMIRNGNYENYKQQLITDYEARIQTSAVSSSDAA